MDFSDMDLLSPLPLSRRQMVGLGLALAGLLLVGCADNQYPTTPPDPRDPNLTWAEKHYIKKMQYQEMTTSRLL